MVVVAEWRQDSGETYTDGTTPATAEPPRITTTDERTTDGRDTAYPADGAQNDLRLPEERQDVERPPGRLAGTVRASAVHRLAV